MFINCLKIGFSSIDLSFNGGYFYVENNKIYYSSKDCRTIEFDTITNEKKIVLSDFKLITMNSYYMVGVTSNNKYILYDRILKQNEPIEIIFDSIVVLNKSLYYVDFKTKYIYEYNIINKSNRKISDRMADKFITGNDNYLFYTMYDNNVQNENKTIYIINLYTLYEKDFYHGIYSYYYRYDNGKLYIHQYNEFYQGNLLALDIFTNNTTTYPINPINFQICNNCIYYQPLYNEYDLKEYDKTIYNTIYKYDINNSFTEKLIQ